MVLFPVLDRLAHSSVRVEARPWPLAVHHGTAVLFACPLDHGVFAVGSVSVSTWEKERKRQSQRFSDKILAFLVKVDLGSEVWILLGDD